MTENINDTVIFNVLIVSFHKNLSHKQNIIFYAPAFHVFGVINKIVPTESEVSHY